MPSMNISLTPELVKAVQSRVESGLYNNASEVIRDALRQMDAHETHLYEIKLAHLRETLAVGLQQAEAGIFADYSLEDLHKELDEELNTDK